MLKNSKIFYIPYFKDLEKRDINTIEQMVDGLERKEIAYQPWRQFTTNVACKISVAHTGNHFIIKFYCKENELNTLTRNINGDVHKDNCVEVFISFDNRESYYNIEFNYLGIAKVGYGSNRRDRKLLSPTVIKKIKKFPKIVNTFDDDKMINWEILLIIPKELFLFSDICSFTGLNCKANFYKCGDSLKKPHFLTWNNIESETPDFHQPKYFGDLTFLEKSSF